MRVLIACEFSGIVRDAFIKRGHDAISCDLRESERPGPHYQGDVFDIIPLLLYVAVPVGIVVLMFWLGHKMPISPVRHYLRVMLVGCGIGLSVLWISDVQDIIAWMFHMAFGGGIKP